MWNLFRGKITSMFQLPKLAYELSDLEPYLSPFQIYTHYYHHHKAYVDNLNKLLEAKMNGGDGQNNPYANATLYEIIMTSLRLGDTKIFHNACQHYNHCFYWQSLTPAPRRQHTDENQSDPKDTFDSISALSLPAKIMLTRRFGTPERFAADFVEVASTMFGSGYAWLVMDPDTRQPEIITTKDGNVPQLYKYFPLLNIDLWEHAFYLDYVFERPKYISGFLRHINWAFVSKNLDDFSALARRNHPNTKSV